MTADHMTADHMTARSQACRGGRCPEPNSSGRSSIKGVLIELIDGNGRGGGVNRTGASIVHSLPSDSMVRGVYRRKGRIRRGRDAHVLGNRSTAPTGAGTVQFSVNTSTGRMCKQV